MHLYENQHHWDIDYVWTEINTLNHEFNWKLEEFRIPLDNVLLSMKKLSNTDI